MYKKLSLSYKISCILLLPLFLLFFAGCEKKLDLKQPATDPFSIFDDAWNTLDQHYVFFSLKNINWDSSYNYYHSQITNNMSSDALFSVISKMFETLQDGHVSLISPFDTATYEGFYQLYAENFNYKNVINTYLKNDYGASGPFIYKIYNNLGYIYYSSFENDVSDAAFDSLLTAMKDTRGLIIDVRNNKGGNPENADKIFQRFIPEKKLVKYEMQKKGKAHNDFSDPVPHYVSPKGFYYNKPICVLTNRKCFSACNDFVLYMVELPNVKLIGDQTGGGGGIPHDYILANGWKMRYTSTVTLSPDKQSIENGIMAYINIIITPIEDMNGDDPILDKAIELLQ